MKPALLEAASMEGEIDNDVYEKFDIAVKLVKSLPQSSSFSPSYAEATKIYSYFKQSKFGACSIPRPGFWDVVNRAKWDAWSALGDMAPEDAMKNYVEEIKKVYYRIKMCDAFEERHVEFADVLIPFCQITGTEMSEKLMEIVKADEKKLQEAITVNEPVCSNVTLKVNGDIVNNGICNGISSHSSSDDVLPSGDLSEVTKTVKFEIAADNSMDISNDGCDMEEVEHVNGDVEDDGLHVKPECQTSSTTYEKLNGELASSEEDSDDEDIYCDSLGPDQIVGIDECSAEVVSITTENDTSLEYTPVTKEDLQVIEDDEHIEAITEPQLFSPVSSNTFQDTTIQNILRKSDGHSPSSSNNSKSEYELVDVPIMENAAFEEEAKHDTSTSRCNDELNRTLSRHSNRKAPPKPPGVRNTTTNNPCHCGTKDHKKDSSVRQSHSGHHHVGRGKTPGGNRGGSTHSNPAATHSRSNTNLRQHNLNRDYQGSSDGSNNGQNGGDDSCSSLSSSSSDNLGLKIVKALERMDDNMHLILKRLDSIDNSIKILADQPRQPWWLTYLPSRSAVMTALWPFIVQFILYCFWRRRRRRQQQRAKSLVVPSFHQS